MYVPQRATSGGIGIREFFNILGQQGLQSRAMAGQNQATAAAALGRGLSENAARKLQTAQMIAQIQQQQKARQAASIQNMVSDIGRVMMKQQDLAQRQKEIEAERNFQTRRDESGRQFARDMASQQNTWRTEADDRNDARAIREYQRGRADFLSDRGQTWAREDAQQAAKYARDDRDFNAEQAYRNAMLARDAEKTRRAYPTAEEEYQSLMNMLGGGMMRGASPAGAFMQAAPGTVGGVNLGAGNGFTGNPAAGPISQANLDAMAGNPFLRAILARRGIPTQTANEREADALNLDIKRSQARQASLSGPSSPKAAAVKARLEGLLTRHAAIVERGPADAKDNKAVEEFMLARRALMNEAIREVSRATSAGELDEVEEAEASASIAGNFGDVIDWVRGRIQAASDKREREYAEGLQRDLAKRQSDEFAREQEQLPRADRIWW